MSWAGSGLNDKQYCGGFRSLQETLKYKKNIHWNLSFEMMATITIFE
jgi:hypothetical protein